jgi:hypothetical protein
MGANKTQEVSAGLESVRRRFERWRRIRTSGSRIPDSLWAAAVRMAETHGIHRTAKALRVNYYSLKEQVEQHAAAVPDSTEGQAVPFLELPSSPAVSPCECTVEWEDTAGAKMRVQFKGSATPDLAALSRSFWNPAS